MIKFWYDMQTLTYRYMESQPAIDGGTWVRCNDGNVERIERSAVLDLARHSRVIDDPQLLLDAIIAAGFKPNKLEGTPGHVAALEKHIAFAESVVNKVLK